MEDLVVLRLALSFVLRGRIRESAALVDIEQLLRNELWFARLLVGTEQDSRYVTKRTLWFRLRSTNKAPVAGGMKSNLESAKQSSQSLPVPSILRISFTGRVWTLFPPPYNGCSYDQALALHIRK